MGHKHKEKKKKTKSKKKEDKGKKKDKKVKDIKQKKASIKAKDPVQQKKSGSADNPSVGAKRKRPIISANDIVVEPPSKITALQFEVVADSKDEHKISRSEDQSVGATTQTTTSAHSTAPSSVEEQTVKVVVEDIEGGESLELARSVKHKALPNDAAKKPEKKRRVEEEGSINPAKTDCNSQEVFLT